LRDETSHLGLILSNYRRSVETLACKIGPRKQAKNLAGVDKTQLNVFSWNLEKKNSENISPGVDSDQIQIKYRREVE
jgi:hypothetical protein